MTDITSLVEGVQSAATTSNAGITEDIEARRKLLKAAQDLVAALKLPDEMVADMATASYHDTSVRIALEMGIFEKLAEAGRPLPVTALLASSTADPQLVLRIARSLVGTGFLADASTADGRRGFAITAVGRQAIVPCARAGLKYHFDQQLDVIRHAPTFFRRNGFQTPKTQSEGLVQYVYSTEDDCYTYWSREAGVMENFNTFMQGYFGSREAVMPLSWFPYDQAFLNGFDSSKSGSQYEYVDVGGGKGHHLQEVLDKYPNAQGKFLLLDVPQVIADIDNTPGVVLSPRIERLGHDFFQAQPVKGARAYGLGNILHNWNDDLCPKILENLKDAMTPGYSKLIVSGVVMPDTNVSLQESALDLLMLFSHNGIQRSRDQWQKLLEGARLRLMKIWTPPGIGNAIVEAEVAT